MSVPPQKAAPVARWNLLAVRYPYLTGSALALLVMLGLLLAVRRLAVAHAAPLPLLATLATAIVVTTIALLLRSVSRGSFASKITEWTPTFAIGVWAVACSFPGSQVGGWVIWALAVCGDLFAKKRLAQCARPAAALVTDQATLSPVAGVPAIPAELESGPPNPLANDPCGAGETVLQNILRIRDETGQEYVYATLRGNFEPGTRTVMLYVGFCPPFRSLPQVEAEVIDGVPAVAKVIQSLHNGAQIEVDLDDPSLEPAHVMVEVAAFEPSAE